MLKSLVKDVALYGIGNFAVKFIAFAVFPLYAHLFTVEEFGVMSLVVTLSSLVGVFIEFGLFNSMGRFYWEKEVAKKELTGTIFWLLFAFSVLFSGLLLLASYYTRESIFRNYGIMWSYVLLSAIAALPKQYFLFAMNLFRIEFQYWKFILALLADNVIGVAAGLVLIFYFKLGLFGFFLGNTIGSLAGLPLILFFMKNYVSFFSYSRKLARELLIYGYPFIFSNIAYWIFGSMDRWMLSDLSNNTEVGLYSIAFKIAMVVSFIGSAFSQAWSPFAMKLYAEDTGYRDIFSKVLTLWFFFITCVGVGISIFGFDLLRLLTPGEYWQAANVITVVIMGAVFNCLQGNTVMGIFLAKKTRLVAYATWITAFLNMLLNFLLIPRFGALGSAYATLLSYLALNGLYLYWSQKYHPIPLEKVKILVSLLVIPVTLLVSSYFNTINTGWAPGAFFMKILYCMVILSLGFAFRIIDISQLKNLIKRKAT
jgi:O-antigen/teichoic acid export membrane protein